MNFKINNAKVTIEGGTIEINDQQVEKLEFLRQPVGIIADLAMKLIVAQFEKKTPEPTPAVPVRKPRPSRSKTTAKTPAVKAPARNKSGKFTSKK